MLDYLASCCLCVSHRTHRLTFVHRIVEHECLALVEEVQPGSNEITQGDPVVPIVRRQTISYSFSHIFRRRANKRLQSPLQYGP